MRRSLGLSLAVLLAALLLALPGLPARLLPGLLDAEQFAMSGVSGTVWNGHAARAVLISNAGPIHLGELRWKLRPLSVLLGSPRLVLTMDWGSQRGTLQARLSGDRVELSELDFALGANIVKQLLPVAVDGRLELLFDELILEGSQVRAANGRAVWRDAGWLAADGRRPLGTYAATLSTEGAGAQSAVNVDIATLAGGVQAEGQGQLGQQRYGLELRLSGDALEGQLAQALALIATPAENGYLLRLDGVLNQ